MPENIGVSSNERLELVKLLFSQVQTLFDQVKGSSDENTKAIEDASLAITELMRTIGSSPRDILESSRKVEDHLKDLSREYASVKEQLAILEKIKESVIKTEDVETKVDKMLGYLSNMDKNMWKLYTVIALGFALGLAVIGYIAYLQHSINDLSALFTKVQELLKNVKP